MPLTPASLKQAGIETDLDDLALQRLIDEAEASVIERAGAETADTVELVGGQRDLHLVRPAASITSVIEREGDTDDTLAADDYTLRPGGWRLWRRGDGTNPSTLWAHRVEVAFVPIDDAARRERIAIDLVKLAIQYDALEEESDGVYRKKAVDYHRERHRLLADLDRGRRRFA